MEEILVMLIIFGTIFGIAYLFFTTRNKERMALIEKGESAEMFNQKRKWSLQGWVLKIGIMFIGVSLGIILGGLIDAAEVLEPGISYPAMIFMCAGIGLVISYFLERKLHPDKD